MEPTNQVIRLADYKPHPRNYNRHPEAQVKRIQASLRKFGQVRSVVVWQGYFLAGHGVAEAARGLGWEKLRADVLPDDYPEHLALAYVAADNELARQGDPDQAQLAAILADSKAADAELLEAIGYSDKEFDELLRSVGAGGAAVADVEPQVDRADELRQKWGTELGQLWQLEGHRLICGDCTDVAVVARVMEGGKAQLCVTSPPYGVGKDYEKRGLEPWMALMTGVIPNIVAHADLAVWNIADLYSTGNQTIEHTFGHSWRIFADNGFSLLWLRIWKKPGIVMDGAPYWSVTYKPGDEYEFIGCFGAPSTKFVERLTPDERHDWKLHGVWEFPSVRAAKDHPAPYPIELPSRAIKMHTDPGDVVLEPFSGSGTTMIACETLQRKCRSIELNPAYVAVTLQRYQDATGKTPELVTGG